MSNNHSKWKLLLILFALLITTGLITATISTAQDSSIVKTDTSDMSDNGLQGERLTLASLLKQAGAWRYPIFGVFFLGLFFSFYQAIIIMMNSFHTKNIRRKKLDQMDISEIEKMVENSNCDMTGLMDMLLRMYRATGKVETFDENISHFIRVLTEKTNSFRNWMSYLSDSAGALGLLGTVVGMFITFNTGGGALQPEAIVQGMGLALITTLLGLVVSLILNLFATLINNAFSGNIEELLIKSDELRFAILKQNSAN